MIENPTSILLNIYKVVCCLSIIGNILAFIVYSRKTFQNTIFSTYFRILTIFDTLTILNGIDDLIRLSGIDTYWTISKLTCRVAYLITYSIPSISSWILSIISIDRCLSIIKPAKYLFRKTIKFQLIVCLFIVLLNFAFHLPTMINANIYQKNESISQLKVCENRNEMIELMDILVGVLIPFIIMFISNIIIINAIFKSRKNTKLNNNNHNSFRDIRYSITSISLNVSYFLLNMPLSIYLALKILIDVDEITDLNITISLSIIYYTHFGTLFYVSFLINTLFRNEFLNLIKDIRFRKF